MSKHKIGRNDPCPCNSGKKYKNCCLEKIEKKEMIINYYKKSIENLNPMQKSLNQLYGKLRNLNDILLTKANITDYKGSTIEDALDFGITSNALSYIKSIFRNSYLSSTNYLNLRNIIEYIAIYKMLDAGDITKDEKILFLEQYKLFEYNNYVKKFKYNENLSDILSDDDFNDIENRYIQAKSKFIEYGYEEKEMKKIIKSRFPFIYNKFQNFNEILKIYCTELLNPYIELSRLIHPNSYELESNDFIMNSLVSASNFIYDFIVDKYGYRDYENEVDFIYEEIALYGINPIKYSDNNFVSFVKRSYKVCKEIYNKFENTYVGLFFYDLSQMIVDINFDYQMGYCENVKIKFKCIVEKFAVFYLIYFDVNTHKISLNLMKQYENLKNQEISLGDKEKIFDKAFILYKEKYRNSKLEYKIFKKRFSKNLGYLIDEKGHVKNYSELVKKFIDEIYNDEVLRNGNMKFFDLMKINYLESQNMSHGCGYLYFANTGAWSDDQNVIKSLDFWSLNIIKRIQILFSLFKDVDISNLEIAEFLNIKLKEMKDNLNKKVEFMEKNIKIIKNY